jgi:putative transcriptional regulator
MEEPQGAIVSVGCLLVATPLLEDPNFKRAVVLILDHDTEDSTLGVVLNRPSEVEVDQVLPGWADLVTGPSVLFKGGPVALDSALAIGRVPGGDGNGGNLAMPLGWRSLGGKSGAGRVGLVDLDAPPALLADALLQLRVFAGYAGWSPGQLRSEIEEGAWYVVDAEPGDAFTAEPDGLWRSVLRRQHGDLALVATFPEDPTLN